MKFRSKLSFSPELRTNTVFCLIFFSFLTLISSVSIVPRDKIKAIWNNGRQFVTCKRDNPSNAGTLKWYSQSGVPIDDNDKAPVYIIESEDSVKLLLVNVPKKHSGTYECRHTLDGKQISSDKFELKVYSAIDMENNKDSYVGTEGHSFTMPCFAKFDSDSSEAALSWSFNSNQIKDKDPHYSVRNIVEQSVIQKSVKSILSIKHLTKENEGTYMCNAVYANPYSTDMKTIAINLRVQFKPRFPQNTQKTVWVSDEQLSGNSVIVNVTCLVSADPPADFHWLTPHGVPIDRANLGVKYSIHNTENLSILSLEYNDLNAIRNNERGMSTEANDKRFQCKASNGIGEAKHTFHINIGKLPETPILDKFSYENGILVLTVNETQVDPPIDIYRVDIDGNHQIYFNASNRNPSANNTYNIIVDVPIGTHHMILYAHNPVGWSESNNPNPALQLVISSASGAKQYLALLVAATLVTVFAF